MSKTILPEAIPSYTKMTGEIYDLIYANKDYKGEAAKLAALIKERCESGGNRILEAACGTGVYMELLSKDYLVDGFDLSIEQVLAARKRLPEARIEQADLVDFDMGERHDVVICLFSSIGYLLSKENLYKSIANMAKHTKPGGLVIVEPFLKVEDLLPNHISIEQNKNNKIAVQRMGQLTRNGLVATLPMHHMIGTKEGIEHFVEIHKLALYSDDDFKDAFDQAGLEVEVDPVGLTGRRLIIGKKPQ